MINGTAEKEHCVREERCRKVGGVEGRRQVGVRREEVNCLEKGGICDHVKIKNIKEYKKPVASVGTQNAQFVLSSMSYIAEAFCQCIFVVFICVHLW